MWCSHHVVHRMFDIFSRKLSDVGSSDCFLIVHVEICGDSCRLMSDMARLEAKVERLTDQLVSKERELQAITSKVFLNI